MPSASSSSSSSSGGRRTALIAGALVTAAVLLTTLGVLHHHRRRQRRDARLLRTRYILALRHIAASAGAAATRTGQRARAAEGGEDDEARWARRKAFFARLFAGALGVVEGDYKFVHVTGTKGKGTVCELVRCGLVAHGKRVGTFTSPHLHTVRERIRIGDELISEADFVRLWDVVQAAFADEEGSEAWCCFFDRVLALALAYFVERRMEYIILEVGIGGRYDPTNFIEAPAVSVITSISYDHVELLGDTLGAIAWQKAGIIKEGRPALTPETQDPAVLRVLRAEAHSRHAPLHEIAVVEDNTNFQGPLGAQGGRCYHPVNLALAKAALRCLLLLSPSPDSPPLAAAASGDTGEAAARDAAVLTKGWVRAFWPGRFEVFSDQRALGPGLAVVLDMAHNVDSVARLLAEAKGRFGSGEAGTELWVLFGTGNDKDAVGMLARLLQGGASESGASVRRLALCQAANARAVPVEALAALAARARQSGSAAAGAVVVEGAGGAVAPGPALERLLREALTESAGTPVALLVCGSLYVVAAARAHLAATRPGLFASREDWAFHPDPPLGGGK